MKKNSRLLEQLHTEISTIENQNDWLHNTYNNTKDYARVMEALNFLTVRRLKNEQLVSITEDLWRSSKVYNFDPLLILALVSVESQGDPGAIGRYRSGKESGAFGLMQIKFATAKEMADEIGYPLENKEDLMKPEVNIVLGTSYLLKLIFKYKSLKLGIMAYNVGPGTMNKSIRLGLNFPKRYYDRTLSNYYGLVRRFGDQSKLANGLN